jgi:hypothetical protein
MRHRGGWMEGRRRRRIREKDRKGEWVRNAM